MRDRGKRAGLGAGGIAGLAAVLSLSWGGAVAGSEAEEASAALETPRTVQFGGVSIGMKVAEIGWRLESNGFRPSERARRRYIDDSGDVRKRIRYRELPGPDGAPTLFELDYTAWYLTGGFDPNQYQQEMRKRFGEPYSVQTPNVGRTDVTYVEVSDAPSVVDVVLACGAEIQKRNPALDAAEAEKQASAAAQYDPANDRIDKTCPGTAPMYRKMAESLEAPRMTIAIRSARVDHMLRWPYLEAELVRRLGREKAAAVLAGVASAPATSGGP